VKPVISKFGFPIWKIFNLFIVIVIVSPLSDFFRFLGKELIDIGQTCYFVFTGTIYEGTGNFFLFIDRQLNKLIDYLVY